MTPLEKLAEIALAAVPDFAPNIVTGNGREPEEFLEENTTKLPSCYISWDGFSNELNYENGRMTPAGFSERCRMYIRVDKGSTTNIREYVMAIRDYINDSPEQRARFVEADDIRRIRFLGGIAERDDKRGDRFTIDILIY